MSAVVTLTPFTYTPLLLRVTNTESPLAVITLALGPAGTLAAVDDVLDAAAAAWSARRVVAGSARLLPDPPERFSDGRPCAIAV